MCVFAVLQEGAVIGSGLSLFLSGLVFVDSIVIRDSIEGGRELSLSCQRTNGVTAGAAINVQHTVR